MRYAYVLLILAVCAPVAELWAQDAQPVASQKAPDAAPTPKAPDAQPKPTDPQAKESLAERIVRLQRTIDENQKQLEQLQTKYSSPESEFAKAEVAFKALDEEYAPKQKEIERLRKAGSEQQAVALETEVADLKKRWDLAKQRYNLAIIERQTQSEQITTLDARLRQDRETLNKLLNPQPATTQPATPDATAAGTTPSGQPAAQTATPESAQPYTNGAAAQPTTSGDNSAAAAPPPTTPTVAVPGMPAPLTNGATPTPAPAKPADQEVAKAKEKAAEKEEAAKQATEEARSTTERLEQIRNQIQLKYELLDTKRRQAENARETQRTLSEQHQKRSAEGAPRSELSSIREAWIEARQAAANAEREVDAEVDRIDDLQEELQRAQADQIEALEEAESRRLEAERAQKTVQELENPFSVRNVWNWALTSGVKIGGILVGMFLILWITRLIEHRVVTILTERASRGSPIEQENRARTVVAVFRNAATVAVIASATLMILPEIGLDIGPLLGGAAVIGLAIAFGAQNLVRDYFTGFMILIENQYGINDVVRIGGVAGLVERITLRMTVLRDLEGTVHFVPNGQITTVSNLTHGWSRALFAIGVSYNEDVDQVIDVLTTLTRELRQDSEYSHLILEDAEMLGLDAFDDSAVVIKFFIKTRPLQQWKIKRALLRRIKKKFDEIGIEIPFPHRTVYHRYEGSPPPGGIDIQAPEFESAGQH